MRKKINDKRLLISKKSLIINISLILITIGLTIFTLIKNDAFNGKNFTDLANVKWYTFLVIFLAIACYILLDSFVIFRSFKRVNPKMSYGDAIGCYFYGNLGSSITPAKAGHHPFRLYYLERKGNNFAQSLANATQCQIIYTFVQVILYGIMTIVCAINNITVKVFDQTVHLYLVGLIGIFMAFSASGILLLMAFCPPIKKVLVKILAWVNVKTKKIKTKEEYVAKQEEKMALLREQILIMLKHFWSTFPSIIAYTISLVLNNCLPYVIYCVIGQHSFNFVELCYFFALFQCISYISNIVPIPGNSGAAEALFSQLYASVCGNSTVLIMLVWRVCGYYIVTIVEMIYFISTTVAHDTIKEKKLHKILDETLKNYTPEVHSHFDTMEMELLSVNFKNTQCYNCCHLQNNLFQCDKYKDKPDEILHNTIRCPFYEERENGDVL